MSSRISSLALAVLLASCGGPPEQVATGNAVMAAGAGTPAEAPVEQVACGSDLTQSCTVERVPDGDGELLTLRHPDGGFRRLRVTGDGSVAAADGAEPATIVARGEDGVEVAIGDARYRVPLPR
ncbi:hypothetical protein [Sphingomonas sp.]|uniref:hypothetical protein n=1 Tax=Sphingomonas sp. TaxID=28214 RepID=UPI002DD65B4C|nr:hypothetical protein [Sphingomonas sp.]